jgi:Rrf2 family protein
MTGRFQIATHILTLLHTAGDAVLSSDYISGSVNANPVLIRKELSILSKLGLVCSKEGKSGGYTLGKPAAQITLADVYNATQVNPVLGKAKNQPNPECKVGKQINQHLNQLDTEISEILNRKLRSQTLAEFCKQFD